MGFLVEVVHEQKLVRKVTLKPGGRVTIGRGEESDLVVADKYLSRRQFSLDVSDTGELSVFNLGGKNPTLIDGERVYDQPLLPGTTLEAGKCRFLIRQAEASENVKTTVDFVELNESGFRKKSSPSSSKSLNHFSDIDYGKNQNLLTEFYALAKQLVSLSTREELYEVVLTGLKRCLPIDRAFIGIGNPQDSSFEIARCTGGGRIKMSRSLLKSIQEDKTAILIEQNSELPLSEAESVQQLGVSSLIFAPILTAQGFEGALYVDRIEGDALSRSDLKCIQGIAHLTATALHAVNLRHKLELDNTRLRERATRKHRFIADSEPMLNLLRDVEFAASLDCPALVCGPSGCGKSSVAQILHEQSARSEEIFISINAALIDPERIESELFGSTDPNFRDLQGTRFGCLRSGAFGTVFINRIEELNPAAQRKLLQALNENSVRPVGSQKQEPIDVRIIAGTRLRLAKLRQSRLLIDELYNWLAGTVMEIPSLYQRRESMEVIANSMLPKGITLSEQCLIALQEYSWPGNLAELKSVLSDACFQCDSDELQRKHLPFNVAQKGKKPSLKLRALTLKQLEEQHIRETLEAHSGNKKLVSEVLGISRTALYNKIKQYGL